MSAFVITFVVLQLMGAGARMSRLNREKYPYTDKPISRATEQACFLVQLCLAGWGIYLLVEHIA